MIAVLTMINYKYISGMRLTLVIVIEVIGVMV